MAILGIDVGGSGIKGALVDSETGRFSSKRLRINTPQPATPEAVIDTIVQIVNHFEYSGPLGVGFPAVVLNGTLMSAANVDKGWIGFPGQSAIARAAGCPTVLLNDADAAGIAEMQFGAGKAYRGVVMIFTLGTGIGSAMFVNGRLVPNLELGHIYMRHMKRDAEDYTSDRVRQEQELGWKEWGERLEAYFQYIEKLFSPNVIIIGGGVSKKHQKYIKHIHIRAELIPAQLLNQAGIVGAALAALPGNYLV